YERPFNATTRLYALLFGGSYSRMPLPIPVCVALGLPCGSAFPSISNSMIVILSILPVYFLCYDMPAACNSVATYYFLFGNIQRRGRAPTSYIVLCNSKISGLRHSC